MSRAGGAWDAESLVADILAVTGGRRPVAAWRDFSAPESWDDLRGPAEGTVELPPHLDWTPGPNVYDLSDGFGLRKAYRLVLHEGDADEICRLVDPRLLASLWGGGLRDDRGRGRAGALGVQVPGRAGGGVTGGGRGATTRSSWTQPRTAASSPC